MVGTTVNQSRSAETPKTRFGRPQGRSVLRSLRRYFAPMMAAVPRQLLRVTFFRFLVCAIRYVWYVFLLRRMRMLQVTGSDVAANTVTHNLRGMFDLAVERSLRLIIPLVSLETVRERVREARILSIGARTEGELYNLYAYGFAKRNVRAVDLVSYSPRVELGDMHALAFADDSFDITLIGWVLAYSDNKAKAAGEIIRVTRAGGLVAIGSEWLRASVSDISDELGYTPGSASRISDMHSLVSLFRENIDHIYFSQDEQSFDAERQVGDLLLIFRVRK